MVRRAGTTRLFSVKVPVILSQTDTTVGFLSQNAQKLYEIKSRKTSKPFIKVYADFKSFLASANRVPANRRNLVRRSKKTTFIVKNRAFRVAPTSLNSQVLRNQRWYFSTSANEQGKTFERDFCITKADIIVEDKYGLKENTSSSLIKINNVTRRRIR